MPEFQSHRIRVLKSHQRSQLSVLSSQQDKENKLGSAQATLAPLQSEAMLRANRQRAPLSH